jgi:hypothetical protein
MATKTKAPERAIANLPRGQRVPIINPPVAPPPSKAEVVKAMVQLYKEQAADALAKAQAQLEHDKQVLEAYREGMVNRREIVKPSPAAVSVLCPGRGEPQYTLATEDNTEGDVSHYYAKRLGTCHWVLTFKPDPFVGEERGDGVSISLPRFRPPQPIADEWKALRVNLDRASQALKDAEDACEPHSVAEARRKIEAEARGPQRARCDAILADPKSRRVLERALKAALASKDDAGRPLVDAETVPA